MFYTIAVFLTLSLSHNVHVTAQESSDCDTIYNAILAVRNDILFNPVVQKYWPNWIEKIKDTVEYMGLIVDSDEELRTFACDLADVKTMSDLSAVTHYPVDVLEGAFTGNQYELKSNLLHVIQSRKELKEVHQWMWRSGFPDNWPLDSVTYKSTMEMLESAPSTTYYTVRLSIEGLSDAEMAAILTNKTISSVEEYIDRLSGGKQLTDFEQTNVDQGLELGRTLATAEGFEDLRSYCNAVETAILAIQSELYHLWRD